MADEVSFERDGRTYRVRGLQAKAQSIANGSSELDSMLGDRVGAARTALGLWRGRHSVTFAEEANVVLGKVAALRVALLQASNTLANFPGSGSSWGSARYQDEVYMGARVDVPVEPGTASANTTNLRSYVTTASGQDERFASLAALVNLEGVTADVTYERPLNDAERRLALDSWENPAILDGVTTPQTDPVDPHTLITLPRPQDQVGALVAASTSLNQYTLAVAAAFDNADSGMLALLGQDPAALQNRLNWLRADPRRWNQLSPAEQEILIEAMPEVVGAMNGLPAVARDRANRIVLQRTKAALQAQLAALQAQAAEPASMYPEYVDPNPGQIAQILDKLRGIERLEQRLADQQEGQQPAFLLGFSGDGDGRVILALGNPDHADNVVTYVPGTGARLGAMRSELPRAEAMVDDANGPQYASESTSVILWMDYAAPPEIDEAAFDHYAENAAPALRSFQEGLDVAHTRGGAYNTVVGHSYGSVVVGEAARGGQLDAENYVFVASPGVNADHVYDLGVPPDRVWASTAPGDSIWIAGATGVHGTPPVDPDFGARTFESSDGGGGSAHSNYWKPGNPARANIAAIVTGNGDRIAPPLPPPPEPSPSPGPAPVPTQIGGVGVPGIGGLS